MKNIKKIIAVIPARGGSKGIPRKNIRLMNGKPLISYVIEMILKSKYIDRVVVSTEDEEIAEVAKFYGAEIIKRPEELSGDAIPLDPVICQAVDELEKKENIKYDFVVTIQPTSPLLTIKTLNGAIETILKGGHDTLIPVRDETALYWTRKNKKFTPTYEKRVNRQYLDPIYQEIGTPLICKREIMNSGSRIGKKILIFEIPKDEGIDIDNYQKWGVVESLLKRKRIILRADADRKIGMGHVHRALTLANRLSFNHDVFFLMDKNKTLGIEKVKENNYKVITFKNKTELFREIDRISPHIIINDIFDTEKKYIKELKKRGCFVVNFEDVGFGSEVADIVVSALYESSFLPKNHYYGYNYACLRDDFFVIPPKKKINKKVKEILITFGGTDPNNLTLRSLQAIEKLGFKTVLINVVLGLGYPFKEDFYNYVENLKEKGFRIVVKENIRMMAKELFDADIAITSNGRTIYEIVSMGVPCISISQNERETRHFFVHSSRCINYLGMAYDISTEDIAKAIEKMIKDYKLRKEIHERMLKFDLKKGVNRVLNLIFDKYYEQKENKNK